MLPTFASSHYKSQMGLKSINEIKLSLAADDILIDFNEILSYDPTNNSYSKNGLYLAFITAGNLAETKMFPLQLNKNVLETDQLTSQAIYASQIWQPLAMHIPEKGRLIICPDGVLNRVSFYMLPASDGKVLLDQHEITIVPNFKIMALTPNQISSAETLMVGAVDYYQSSHDTLAEMPNNLLKINSIEIADATFRSNHQFTQTTNSVQELNTLAALLLKKKKKVEMLTSKEASKSNLHRLLDKNKYNVLHLSMPAFLLEKSDSTFSELIVPNLNSSGLALAGSYNSWSVDSLASGVIDDGLLTAAEIQTLDLATTDLVVMPSINGSSSSQGVSLASLQHAFLDAGAKYVIVSLWPALEKDRLAFFQLFYKNLLKTASVKTAFRKTQLQVKKKSDAKYWAGYILTP
jgi:CHAT domain-containing protein